MDLDGSSNFAKLLEFSRAQSDFLEVKTEATVVYSQDLVRKIALRIERAYCRKYPKWCSAGLTPGVWESAAYRLLEASTDKLGFPIDPELYVAVQDASRVNPDPWEELTQSEGLVRYRKALKRMISRLRQELTLEVTRAECRLLRGVDLDEVLETEGRGISPLARYVLAYKAGRHDLTAKHYPSALNQHRSCPLYLQASRKLIPAHAYPSVDLAEMNIPVSQEIIAFSLN